MNDNQPSPSKIKNILNLLNKIKVPSKAQQSKSKSSTKLINLGEHQSIQFHQVSTNDIMLSNYDLHVKNLISSYIEEMDGENQLQRSFLPSNDPKPFIKQSTDSTILSNAWGRANTDGKKKKKTVYSKPRQSSSKFLRQVKLTDHKKKESLFKDSDYLRQTSTKIKESLFKDPDYLRQSSIKRKKDLSARKDLTLDKSDFSKTFKRSLSHYLDSTVNYSKKRRLKTSKELPALFDFLKQPEFFHDSDIHPVSNVDINDISNESFKRTSTTKINEPSTDIVKLAGLTKDKIKELKDIKHQLKKNVFIRDEIEEESSNDKNSSTVHKNELSDQKAKNETSSNSNENTTQKNSYEEKFRNLTRKGYVYDSLDDEEIENEDEGFFYIHPNSKFVYVLECAVFFVTFYSMINIPYRIAHDLNLDCKMTDGGLYIFILEIFVDLINTIDFLTSFIIGFYNFEEVLITDFHKIAFRYILSWGIFDCISAIPFNSILLFQSFNCLKDPPIYYNTGSKHFKYFLCNCRLFKIFKIFFNNKFASTIQNIFNQFHHFSLWNKFYTSLFTFIIALHILSCIFIFLGQNDYPNWIVKYGFDTSGFWTLYITSVYYLLSCVTTVGYGDITSVNRYEQFFSLILLLVGIMVYSWALTSVSNYIKEKDEKTIDYTKKTKILEEIKLSYQQMPEELYDKIARFLKYRMIHGKEDKNIVIDCLPIGLRNNLIYEMYKPIIKDFVFFKNYDNMDFIVRVILCFRPIIGVRTDILVKEGDFIEEIIFVKKGSLNLEIPIFLDAKEETYRVKRYDSLHPLAQQKNGTFTFKTNNKLSTIVSNSHREKSNISSVEEEYQYVKILEIRKNEHFGDVLMFLNRRSPLCVKVKSKMAELFFLDKTDAIDISTSYPQIWRRINKKSLFNMEQIERLINRAVSVCNSAMINQYNHFVGRNSRVRGNCDLLSIPSSISDSSSDKSESFETETFNSKNTKNNECSLNQSKDIIEEDVSEESNRSNTNHCDSQTQMKTDESNSALLCIAKLKQRSNKSVKSIKKLSPLDGDPKKKSSTKFKVNSNKLDPIDDSLILNSSCRVNLINEEGEDTKRQNIENKPITTESSLLNMSSYRTELIDASNKTPFTDSQINTEFYPVEKEKDNFISSMKYIKHKPICLFNLPSFDEGVNSSYLHDNFSEDEINTLRIPTTERNFRTEESKSKNKALSFCPGVIDINIPSLYENINELSHFNYSKHPHLRLQVKNIVQDISASPSSPASHVRTTFTSFKGLDYRKKSMANPSSPISPSHGFGKNDVNELILKRRESRANFFQMKDDIINNIVCLQPKKKESCPKVIRLQSAEKQEKQEKKDLLNVISENIEKNSLNLKNPDVFYSNYFQQLLKNKAQSTEEGDLK